ncbi:MAG: bifunctional demethylmenaquinone methyltransferase/2-methoxy-6-polyprenyl-1,4-benzoquinol methylase UbiE [Deltaproteobacteria bacterium]|nr:bifunctional demethylmenaquinone methyltransferase/2-methoxy-6-polyprenyl-1,4-benzoquinol methylase UbiE [Deltaproteobacteria bacterium]
MKNPEHYRIDNKTPEHKKKFIQNLFNSIVPTYDLLNHVLSGGIDMIWRTNIFRYLETVKNNPAIDLCCGTGDLSKLLYRKGAKLVSLDFSFNMLEKGNKKVFLQGASVAADASNIPFKNNSFHTATIAFGIRNIPDLDTFIKDVHRVLNNGGQLAILELVKPEHRFIGFLYSFYLGTILPLIGGIISGKQFAYNYLSKTIATFINPFDLQTMLEKYGFSKVKHYPQTLGIATIIICKKRNSLVREL